MNKGRFLCYASLYLILGIYIIVRGDLVHRYSFTDGDTVAVDSVGDANGTLENGASISGNAVQLDGRNDYVNLPSGIITGFTSVTFEAWFTHLPNNTWTRVLDFGDTNPSNGAGRYCLFFTPDGGSSQARLAISDADPGYNHEEIAYTSTIDFGVPVYVACVYDDVTDTMSLYVDGQLAHSIPVTIPLTAVDNVYSYLGNSTYTVDPELEGSIDEFRIYDSALGPEMIELNYLNGPDVVGEPPVVIEETDGSTEVSEEGESSDEYTVVLSSQPQHSVTLTVEPDEQLDIGNGRGNSVDIVFNTGDWDSERTVTVEAFDDDIFEGNPHTGIIRHYVSSDDPNFNDKPLPAVYVSIQDNECGAWGFFYSDLNYNCLVNFKDYAIFALYWFDEMFPLTLDTLASEWLKTTQPYAPDAEYGPVFDSPNPLFIEPNEVVGEINEKVYGHFLEHIYHSVNGGLWGDLVWNRSFELYSGNIGTYWTSYGSGGTFTISSTDPLNSDYSQRIDSTGSETGVQQTPFFIENGLTYYGSLWARSSTAPASMVVRLKDGSTTIQEQAIAVTSSSWAEYPFTFTPGQSAEDAILQVGITGSETVYLDQVSMMGQDSNDTGGYRPDLLQAIDDLHPPCIRWPGGCFASLYLWKDGIGPQHTRFKYPAYMWDDQDINSYGTDEFLRMCEILGVEPIIVINTGLTNSACGGTAQFKLPDPCDYLPYALDWMEYCNGDANTTTWGAERAANGHPTPYNVKYWEIDNETWWMGISTYCDVVNEFAPAMRTKAAELGVPVKIIACGSGSFGYSWDTTLINNCADVIDYVSIHHYESGSYQSGPLTFESYLYQLGDFIADSDNPDIRIDASEWNYQTTDWRTGLYAGGLLNGFERASDYFEIGGPALFMRHQSASGWDNAFINFDHTGWFPAPNYVVMKLWHDNYAPYRISMTGNTGSLNAVATESADGNDIYFKAVNPTDQSVPVKLVISDNFDAGSATLQLVAPDSLYARNTLEDPDEVQPEEVYVSLVDQIVRFTMPRLSAGVVKISREE